MTVSYSVTLKKLFLGDQDTTTGWYQRGFTIHSITGTKYPAGTSFDFGASGRHTTYTETLITQYEVNEGDVIEDAFEKNYDVTAVKEWAIGDQLQFYEVSMIENPLFPFLTGFFGFEDTEHETIGYGFEDGFERGTWAL